MAQDRDRPAEDKNRTNIPKGYDPTVRRWGEQVKDVMKGLGFGTLDDLHEVVNGEYKIGLSEGAFKKTLAGRPSNQQVKVFEAIAEIFARKECSRMGASAAFGETLAARKEGYNRYIFTGEPLEPFKTGIGLPEPSYGPYAVQHEITRKLVQEFTAQSIVPLMGEPLIVNSALRRAQQNFEVLAAFLRATKDWTQKPTIRMYGNFTSLANSRQAETGSSDYVGLILEEVALTDEFVRQGYDVRVIASLDVRHILNTWTSKERLLSRTAAMADKIRHLERRYINLTIGIDTHSRMQGLFILGNSLTIRARDPVHGQGYSLTSYETDSGAIMGDAHAFETTMAEVKKVEFTARKALEIDSFADFFRRSAGRRLYNAQLIGSEQFKPTAYL